MKWNELVGKTIKAVDDKSAVNVVALTFTDGTETVIDTEAAMHVPGGSIYRPILVSPDAYLPDEKR